MKQLTCENITLGYDGKVIVSGLSFSVDRGDYLCIVGENGSGKSTLVKAILGLHAPVSGTLAGSKELVRSGIGYLPQQTPVQRDFPASVEEIVMSGFVGRHKLSPFYTKQEKAQARSYMERLGIAELARRCYRELSGGQQQRVLLARALCATCDFLLLDEPVSGLDPMAAAELYRMIEEINREDGITVVMVSHDVEAVIKYANHVLHIGDEIFFGSTRDYLATPMGKRFEGEV